MQAGVAAPQPYLTGQVLGRIPEESPNEAIEDATFRIEALQARGRVNPEVPGPVPDQRVERSPRVVMRGIRVRVIPKTTVCRIEADQANRSSEPEPPLRILFDRSYTEPPPLRDIRADRVGDGGPLVRVNQVKDRFGHFLPFPAMLFAASVNRDGHPKRIPR